MPNCICCNKPGQFSVLIASETEPLPPIWFCHACIRTVENAFRATILYLKAEHGLLDITRL
jgi:hypothetical protein